MTESKFCLSHRFQADLRRNKPALSRIVGLVCIGRSLHAVLCILLPYIGEAFAQCYVVDGEFALISSKVLLKECLYSNDWLVLSIRYTCHA